MISCLQADRIMLRKLKKRLRKLKKRLRKLKNGSGNQGIGCTLKEFFYFGTEFEIS